MSFPAFADPTGTFSKFMAAWPWAAKPERFETYLDSLKIWFSVSVYSPEKGYFISIFDNISERKRAEEVLDREAGRRPSGSLKRMPRSPKSAGLSAPALLSMRSMKALLPPCAKLISFDRLAIRTVDKENGPPPWPILQAGISLIGQRGRSCPWRTVPLDRRPGAPKAFSFKGKNLKQPLSKFKELQPAFPSRFSLANGHSFNSHATR